MGWVICSGVEWWAGADIIWGGREAREAEDGSGVRSRWGSWEMGGEGRRGGEGEEEGGEGEEEGGERGIGMGGMEEAGGGGPQGRSRGRSG